MNGTVNAYIKDTHGNVIGVTDDTGVIVNNYEYDAFGVQISGDSVPSPFGYCGEYLDNESGLIYLRNRYYDAGKGRFINEDPIKDGLNWYAYCGNNPVSFVDPLGLWIVGVTPFDGMKTDVIANVQEMDTGVYAGLRDIANFSKRNYSLSWEDNGDGAIATYSIKSGTYAGYIMHIKFDSKKEGTYASEITYEYEGDIGSVDITNATTNTVRDKIKAQNACFFLKKDENGPGLVVMAKLETILDINGCKDKAKYIFGVLELAQIDVNCGNKDYQKNLDKWSKVPLIGFDPEGIVDAYNAKHASFDNPQDVMDWMQYMKRKKLI